MRLKKVYIVIGSVLLILIAVRISLPFFAKQYINKELDKIDGYHASIENVSMSLFSGAFGLSGLVIYEELSAEPEIPMVNLPQIDFSIDWKALFKGHIVSVKRKNCLKGGGQR